VRTCFPAEWCEPLTSEAIKATFPTASPLFIAGFKVQNADLLGRDGMERYSTGKNCGCNADYDICALLISQIECLQKQPSAQWEAFISAFGV